MEAKQEQAADLVRRMAYQEEVLLALVSLFHSTYTWERIWYSMFRKPMCLWCSTLLITAWHQAP